MSDHLTHGGYAAVNKPTLWYRLGFHWSFDEALFDWRNEEPKEGDWWVPSALTTTIHVRVSWLDRLKLLLSGHCAVELYTRTDVVVNRAETRSHFAVLSP